MGRLQVLFLYIFTSIFATANTETPVPLAGTPIVFTNAEKINKHTTRIPFKLVDRLLVVEAAALGKKGNFIIDTGSEALILNKGHFKANPYRIKSTKTAGVLETLDAPIEKKLEHISLQGLHIKDKMSDVIDLSHIEKSKKVRILGVIGYQILKDYEVFIDLHLHQITLSKVDVKGNKLTPKVYLEEIVDSLSFTLKKHTIVVEGSINSKKLFFGLDTAAEFNQLNKNVPRNVLKAFHPKQRIKLRGAGNREIEVLTGKLFRLKLSNTVYFGPMDTMLTNLNTMNEAFGTQLDGILGYEFFARKRTIINYQKQKLYFINFPFIRN